jgi:triphosphoribosyl-dephospho-CoA synthetase
VRADLRQPPFGEVGEPLVQRPGDGELEDAVAEELEPLVGIAAVGRPRRVRERVVETLRRELLDEGSEPGAVARRFAATGAT